MTSEEYSSERIATIYSNISKDYTASDYTGEPVTVSEENSVTAGGKSTIQLKLKGMKKATKFWICRAAKKSHLIFAVPEDGLYYMNFDYLSYDDSILPVSMKMKVDGKYPFYECRSLEFETTWKLSEEESI